MKKLDKMIDIAAARGMDVISIEFINAHQVQVRYHVLKLAGPVPIQEHCRDKRDYDLLMVAWSRRGTVYSPVYPNLRSLLSGEILRLRQ